MKTIIYIIAAFVGGILISVMGLPWDKVLEVGFLLSILWVLEEILTVLRDIQRSQT